MAGDCGVNGQGSDKEGVLVMASGMIGQTAPECVPNETIAGEINLLKRTLVDVYDSMEILERAVTDEVLSGIFDDATEPKTVSQELAKISLSLRELNRRLMLVGAMASRQLNGLKLE